MDVISWIDKKVYDYLAKTKRKFPKRINQFLAYFYTDARIRKKYLRELYVFMDEGTYANIGLIADATANAPVWIGKNVSIAPYVRFITNSCPNNSQMLQENDYLKRKCIKSLEIIVEDNVWIGTNVTILPGVKIGRGAVVGADSLVISDIECNSIYAGTPAKKVRSIESGGDNMI